MTHQSIKHCAFKKEPSVEESIEDSISIHNYAKEVFEEQLLKKEPSVEESIEDSVEYSIPIHNDGKEVFEEQQLILPESFGTEGHCTLKNEPFDDESIEDTSSADDVYKDVKEVIEGKTIIVLYVVTSTRLRQN